MKFSEYLPHDKLYCIYDDSDDDDFYVGYPVYSDERYSIFNLFTTRGYEDGLYCTLTDCIYRMDYDDLYTERILKLSKINGQERMTVDRSFAPDPLVALFEYAGNQSFFVTVELENGSYITGEVERTDGDLTAIRVVNDDGIDNGTSVFRNDSVVSVHVNSGVERNVQNLRDLNRC